MKKLRRYDLKDRGYEAYKALCDLERVFTKMDFPCEHVDEDDEYFEDKTFVTDLVWISTEGYWGITFEAKRFVPKFISVGYLRMLLWFAKHGACEQRGELA